MRSLEIPEEIISNQPFFSILGKKRIQIENYHCICSFTQRELIIVTKVGRVRILGEQLLILMYTPKLLQIEGTISEIHFEK